MTPAESHRILFLSCVVLLTLPAASGCPMQTTEKRTVKSGDHFDGTRFHNVPRKPENGTWAILKWMVSRDMGEWDDRGARHEPGPPPPQRIDGDGTRVTFVNHTTVLIQTGGMNILTDPIYAERASPLSWAGPRRVRQPGIRFEDLPEIHVILLSHNHYDHLCLDTLRRLQQRDHPSIYTGLGNADLLIRKGLGPVTEMDWWQNEALAEEIVITFVPAQHFSGRGLFDRYETLWGGFMIATGERLIYFAGDTGAGPHFAEIRERLGPPDLALIPVGAYRPRYIMEPVHLSPPEAVAAHRQVGARRSMATHFGTFPLADDGQREPIELLDVALGESGLTRDDFWVLDFGEGRDVPSIKPSIR